MTRLSITQPDIRLGLDLQGVIREVALSDAMAAEQLQPWVGRAWDDTVGQGGVGPGGDQVRRMVEEARTTGVSGFGQLTQSFPSGRQLPIEYTTIRLGQGDGLIAVGKNLVAVSTVQSRLVAAQRAREQEYWQLRDVDTRYRLLFDASSEAVVLLDPDSLRIVEVNPAAIRAFGFVPGHEFLREVAGAERGELRTMLGRLRSQGRSPAQIVHLGPDRAAWVLRTSLMPSEPMPVILLQLSQAAEGLAAAAAPSPALEDLADRLPDAFVVIDREGLVRRANPAFLDLVQANAEAAVLGEHLGRWLRHPGSDLGVILGIIDRHRIVRRLATTIYGMFDTDTAVELSAVGSSDIRPLHVGIVLRNVERRPREDEAEAAEPDHPVSHIRLAAELGRTPLSKLVRDMADVVERDYIAAALERAGGNRSAAAELLGLSRQTLYMKLARYGLEDDVPAAARRTA